MRDFTPLSRHHFLLLLHVAIPQIINTMSMNYELALALAMSGYGQKKKKATKPKKSYNK
jgi:hypothetical protein